MSADMVTCIHVRTHVHAHMHTHTHAGRNSLQICRWCPLTHFIQTLTMTDTNISASLVMTASVLLTLPLNSFAHEDKPTSATFATTQKQETIAS